MATGLLQTRRPDTSVFEFIKCSKAKESSNFSESCTVSNLHIQPENRSSQFCNQHIVIAELLNEFFSNIDEQNRCQLVLQEDGTIISDDEYLQYLPAGTKMTLRTKLNEDEIDQGLASEEPLKVNDLNITDDTEETMFWEEDRKILESVAKKLKGNLDRVMVLSQDELQVLHETSEHQLQSLLCITSSDASKLQSICFTVFITTQEKNDTLAYLDLVKRAEEWKKQQDSTTLGKVSISAGGVGGGLQFDGHAKIDGARPSQAHAVGDEWLGVQLDIQDVTDGVKRIIVGGAVGTSLFDEVDGRLEDSGGLQFDGHTKIDGARPSQAHAVGDEWLGVQPDIQDVADGVKRIIVGGAVGTSLFDESGGILEDRRFDTDILLSTLEKKFTSDLIHITELSKEEYQFLSKEENLKELKISDEIHEDVLRYCKERVEIESKEDDIRSYFAEQLKQIVA